MHSLYANSGHSRIHAMHSDVKFTVLQQSLIHIHICLYLRGSVSSTLAGTGLFGRMGEGRGTSVKVSQGSNIGVGPKNSKQKERRDRLFFLVLFWFH